MRTVINKQVKSVKNVKKVRTPLPGEEAQMKEIRLRRAKMAAAAARGLYPGMVLR